MMNKNITIRPEEHKDYKSIISLILRSFQMKCFVTFSILAHIID